MIFWGRSKRRYCNFRGTLKEHLREPLKSTFEECVTLTDWPKSPNPIKGYSSHTSSQKNKWVSFCFPLFLLRVPFFASLTLCSVHFSHTGDQTRTYHNSQREQQVYRLSLSRFFCGCGPYTCACFFRALSHNSLTLQQVSTIEKEYNMIFYLDVVKCWKVLWFGWD